MMTGTDRLMIALLIIALVLFILAQYFVMRPLVEQSIERVVVAAINSSCPDSVIMWMR